MVRHQKQRWSRAVDAWDHHGVAGLESVIDTVVRAATETTGPDGRVAVAVDLGAGTGALSIPLAAHAEKVLAVDVSAAMLDRLAEHAASAGIDNIELRACPIENLDIPAGSVDLIVSNYALHHLLDPDKGRVVQSAAGWLRPGGSLVIGDMMIGRGGTAEDRSIFASKVKVMLSRGPAGWWRIAKNAWKLLLRTSERPLPLESWADLLRQHGFVDISAVRVVAEAGLVTGRRPHSQD